jgi:cellobiose phosphorylase
MIWQFEGGDYAHGGNFLSMQGTRTFHSDDPINPAFILANYVRETGDYSILDEITAYAHTNGEKTDSIYNHIIKGFEFFFDNFSERGLPLILKADWNDALDQVGNERKGDSVMLGFWAIYCMRQFYTCMEYMQDTERMAEYEARLTKLATTLDEVAWDGDWYQRAMHDSGYILGTKDGNPNPEDNKYAWIWSDPNSFAIACGIPSEEKKAKIFAAMEKYLDCELGSYPFYPPYMVPEPRAGIISRFAPGTKENGSVFGHCSRWRIWAECLGGRGDKAYEILHKMLPPTRHEADPDLYRIEPYAACQYINSYESDRPGEGSHSWATGTAPWTLIVVWENILGVKPEVDGLHIDPCMPSHWTTAKMTREYRGATYEISFSKPEGICKGRLALTLDGVELPGNVIAPQGDGKTHQVNVQVLA